MKHWKYLATTLGVLLVLATAATASSATQGIEKQPPTTPAVGSQTATFVPTNSPPPGAGGPTTCTAIRVTAAGPLFLDGFESGNTQAWGGPGDAGTFSVALFEDLRFDVRFTAGSSGDHLLHLDLETPRGHHYQRLTVPVTSAGAQRGSTRKVEGFPYPLEVQTTTSAEGTNQGAEVTLSLPVAGTVIVSNALYGSWTAKALLDNETVPCASATYSLAP